MPEQIESLRPLVAVLRELTLWVAIALAALSTAAIAAAPLIHAWRGARSRGDRYTPVASRSRHQRIPIRPARAKGEP